MTAQEAVQIASQNQGMNSAEAHALLSIAQNRIAEAANTGAFEVHVACRSLIIHHFAPHTVQVVATKLRNDGFNVQVTAGYGSQFMNVTWLHLNTQPLNP